MTRQALNGGTAAQGLPVHGGPDALGVPLHDFSTNANACGPCPTALAAVREADAARYPDPAYTALREALSAWHGVAPERIVPAASASEFIHRFTAWATRQGVAGVVVPAQAYGDYARAARAWGLPLLPSSGPRVEEGAEKDSGKAVLHWACEPGSPLGTSDPALEAWRALACHGGGAPDAGLRIVDCAYAPLRLEATGGPLPTNAWQLWTPNKALGLTGVRAAYAVAPACVPQQCLDALQALAPSWPIGAHGVAMLSAWVALEVQDWLAASLDRLRGWKAAQILLCEELGWNIWPGSLSNYFAAMPPPGDMAARLAALRAQGVKVRDAASFGLNGWVRLGVLDLRAQQAFARACRGMG
ncbi:aminotransferase class I/II-fold pyridoxal phosphate-dependent enzyme [Paracidovorax cattleyae]|uniref:histidinol-phosphate transaminase n=1 Tax=Paracidovorax cattleyae TaxID=80868 RepID=A0A1H0S2E3_9BURK|nr:aminotransferase class I/II-fold pyridoxal phosphate-dependent enzyme [Paracidovorax cattleyae]SDP35426.1 histidinol-phosphate aminotransferase [Paracidovorax cattleyae]